MFLNLTGLRDIQQEYIPKKDKMDSKIIIL